MLWNEEKRFLPPAQPLMCGLQICSSLSITADRSALRANFCALTLFQALGQPLTCTISITVLPWWFRQYKICLQRRRPGFDPWVRKIAWRRKWQPTPVLSPGKSHGQRSLAGYILRGHRVRHDLATKPLSFMVTSLKR